jgi:broad specificity phosphatase PhoE
MIYLLRHGEDDENYVGGWSNGDLTSTGYEQVNNVGSYLASHNYHINQIYASDIKRAATTAQIISSYINCPITYMQELRELNKGLLTGMRVEDATKYYPLYTPNNDIYQKYPNGESMYDLYCRINKLLESFIVNQENALFVTHRGVINMLYFILNDITLNMDKKQFNVIHASLHELDIQAKTIRKIY